MAIGPLGPAMMTEGPMDGLLGLAPTVSSAQLEQEAKGEVIPRDVPTPERARSALVDAWTSKVKRAKKYWEPTFKQMREDQHFARGRQWSKDDEDKRYVANLTLRLIQQRTAFLYAKNPKFVARRRERLLNTVWDGNQSTLNDMMQAAGSLMMGGGTLAGASMDPNGMVAVEQQYMAIAQDAARVKEQLAQLDKIAKTLELLFTHNIATQTHDFKKMMKMVVRRAVTTGVAYVKLGFERVMDKRPEIEARISDLSERLSTLERLSADMVDKITDADSAQSEQLRLMMQDLQTQVEFVAREGLVIDYPLSTSIIPDPKMVALPEFLGADWVAQEYILSPNEVKEIYDVDVGKQFTTYKRGDGGTNIIERAGTIMLERQTGDDNSADSGDDAKSCAVWEVYSRKDGLIYILCDGYPDFLREPAAPDCYTDRFWPWFPLTFNDADHEEEVFPPSDVRLVRDMQMEFNRARQGLREHRRAARPKTVVAAGMVDDEDLEKLQNHPDNAIIELNGLQPGQKVDDLLQSFRGPPIDPNIYEVEQLYSDILRTTGVQEANLGGTNRSTATQSNIAEASRNTAMGSNIDDLDDLLTQLARTGGQILLQEVSGETAKQIVGEGAVWPELTKQQIVDEIWLEIEAGSTGRPNQAQEISNAERLFPILMQIPGINPEFVAKELLRRLDDRLDLSQAFKSMLPSIMAMNAMSKGAGAGIGAAPGGAGSSPAAQGQAGAANAPRNPPPGAQQAPDQVSQATGAPPPPGMPMG